MSKRIVLLVEVDLDPVPGVFHTPASVRKAIQTNLDFFIDHYNPIVEITNHEPIGA